jgi:hypothetical protein
MQGLDSPYLNERQACNLRVIEDVITSKIAG